MNSPIAHKYEANGHKHYHEVADGPKEVPSLCINPFFIAEEDKSYMGDHSASTRRNLYESS